MILLFARIIFKKKKVNFHLPNKKVFILPNPINTNFKFAYNNIENRKYDVIWVGKLDKVKNPIIALNIARKLSNYKFLFLFNIQNDRYNFFDLMLRFKTSNIDFQIDIDYEVSDKFFSQSKIYINTSLFEGFPNALLQAGKYGCPFISLNVNPDNIFNNDIGYFLSKINNKYIKNSINKNNEWINFTKSLKKKYPIVKDEYFKQKKYVNPYVFFNVFSSISKKSDILIPDASANLIWAYQSLVPKMGQQIFTALNHSPMGYSIAASVGAKLYQNKNKLKGNVSAFIGDGSVAMNVQELETIAFNNLNVKIFIFNNNGYGLIKGTLELFLNKNYVGVDPSSGLSIQDFKKMAYSYNIPYIKIDNHINLEKKLKRIQNSKSPIICDLIVNPNQKVIPKLSSGNPIHLMSPLLDNLKIDEAMKYTK